MFYNLQSERVQLGNWVYPIRPSFPVLTGSVLGWLHGTGLDAYPIWYVTRAGAMPGFRFNRLAWLVQSEFYNTAHKIPLVLNHRQYTAHLPCTEIQHFIKRTKTARLNSIHVTLGKVYELFILFLLQL